MAFGGGIRVLWTLFLVLYRVSVQLLGKIYRHLRMKDNCLSAVAIAALICVDNERLLLLVTPIWQAILPFIMQNRYLICYIRFLI